MGNTNMKPIEIKKDIWWVGAIDWDLRDFHGYETEKGSTYNAYLVKGNNKIALFDTVKVEHTETLISNIKQIIDPVKIDYIISNHSEMDHTGALPGILDVVKPEKLFCSRKGEETLKLHFHRDDWPLETVDKETVLDLGGKTVHFISSPMLHWPESMVSYIPEDAVLISNDIFGQHFATSERFDDEVDRGELYWQSAKYYANIFLPVSAGMSRFVDKLENQKLKLDILAVDHGLIWRKDIDGILKKYRFWSSHETIPKAIIVYDTMWGSTAKMAKAVADGITGGGISVKVFDLHHNHRSDIITEALDARAIILGSSVLNKNILPKMADFVTYMKGLSPGNKIGAAFASYGWNDVATKQLNEVMEELKFEIVDPGVGAKYVPSDDDLKKCRELGEKIRQAVLK